MASHQFIIKNGIDLRVERARHGLNQDQLAALLNRKFKPPQKVTRALLSLIENEIVAPTDELSRQLGVIFSELSGAGHAHR